MAIEAEKLNQILTEKFPNAQIKIVDLVGDNNHYAVEIISDIFKDKSKIEQHKLVNAALKGILGGELHALQITTKSN